MSKRLLLGIACLCFVALTSLMSQAATVYLDLYPLTGELRLENRSSDPFKFTFYEVDSSNMALIPANWTSISDTYDASGNGFIDATHEWTKLPATTSKIAEGAVLLGSVGTLPPYRSIGLGRVWNPNTVPVDYLTAIVKQPDESNAIVEKTLNLDGDYAADHIVNQLDYSFWSLRFGQTDSPYADGNHNGIIDAADYTFWRDHLGSSLSGFSLGAGSGAGGLAAAAVPEPSSVMLTLVAGGALGWRIRARRNLCG